MFERSNPNYYIAIWNRETTCIVTGALTDINVDDGLIALNDNNKLVIGKLLQRGSLSFVAFAYNESDAYEILREGLPERFTKIANGAKVYTSRTRDEWSLIRPDTPKDELDDRIERNRRMNQNRYNRAMEQLDAINKYPMKFKDL